jgi:COPI associated protein
MSNPVARNMAANEASQYYQQGTTGLKSFIAEENVWSMKLLSFFTGLAMFILSFLAMINVTGLISSAFDYLMNFYFIVFSFAIIFHNSKDSWPGVGTAQAWIGENFGIMNSNFGRGSMYIFLGSLWIASSNNPLTKILGYVLWALGGLYVLTGYLIPCIRERFSSNSSSSVPQTDLEMQGGIPQNESTAIPIGRK